jgi:hypothetical protein
MLIFSSRSFKSERLVFIPDEQGPGTWTHLQLCVWDGPKCLRKTPCLKDYYPQLQNFFCGILDLREANIKTLVREASQLNAHDDLAYVEEMLVAVNDHFAKPALGTTEQSFRKESIDTLEKGKIFPINNKKPSQVFDYLGSTHSMPRWYIADRPHLRHSFERLLPLLAVSTEVIEKISTLIESLGLQNRTLSKVATGVSESQGRLELLDNYSNSLRSKAVYIAR